MIPVSNFFHMLDGSLAISYSSISNENASEKSVSLELIPSISARNIDL